MSFSPCFGDGVDIVNHPGLLVGLFAIEIVLAQEGDGRLANIQLFDMGLSHPLLDQSIVDVGCLVLVPHQELH